MTIKEYIIEECGSVANLDAMEIALKMVFKCYDINNKITEDVKKAIDTVLYYEFYKMWIEIGMSPERIEKYGTVYPFNEEMLEMLEMEDREKVLLQEWLKLGFTKEKAEELTKLSMTGDNMADILTEDVVKNLSDAMKKYEIDNENMELIDRFNQVKIER